jgi:hypothetical protein
MLICPPPFPLSPLRLFIFSHRNFENQQFQLSALGFLTDNGDDGGLEKIIRFIFIALTINLSSFRTDNDISKQTNTNKQKCN